MVRYVHTNIIAKDHKKLIDFYKNVFECKSIGETRDLRGEWLNKLTGIHDAHIVGEHLCLPGYNADHPTLEIFSYDEILWRNSPTQSVRNCAFSIQGGRC